MSTTHPIRKVALVTGANSGIGRVTARELALRGYHVFVACRSEARTRPVLDEIRRLSGGRAQAEFLPLDLGDFDSVHAAPTAFWRAACRCTCSSAMPASPVRRASPLPASSRPSACATSATSC